MRSMSYTTNPYLPRLRAQAAEAVKNGSAIRAVARKVGVQPSTVLRWVRRAPLVGRAIVIPTRSSRPHHHPRTISADITTRISELRRARGRCARAIHAQLRREGILVSFSTVHRTLVRQGFVRTRSPRKLWHHSGERPTATAAGNLVEIDSIHLWYRQQRQTSIITLIDVFSRWAYARALTRLTAPAAVRVVASARHEAPFRLRLLQSDHGSEFSGHFTRRLTSWDITHRHIRVRMPNDNAHIERFNRTLQDDLRSDLIRFPDNPRRLNEVLVEWLKYYNAERLHQGIAYQTPLEVLRRS